MVIVTRENYEQEKKEKREEATRALRASVAHLTVPGQSQSVVEEKSKSSEQEECLSCEAGKSKEIVWCYSCGQWTCNDCLQWTLQLVKSLQKRPELLYFCGTCRFKLDEGKKPAEERHLTMGAARTEIRNALKEMVEEEKGKFEESLKRELSSNFKSVTEEIRKQQGAPEENQLHQREFQILSTNIAKEMDKLRNICSELEQGRRQTEKEKREKNLILNGIPETDEDGDCLRVAALLETLGTTGTPSAVERVGSRKDKARPVRVFFNTSGDKWEVLRKSKDLRSIPITKHLTDLNLDPRRIFMACDLTPDELEKEIELKKKLKEIRETVPGKWQISKGKIVEIRDKD